MTPVPGCRPRVFRLSRRFLVSKSRHPVSLAMGKSFPQPNAGGSVSFDKSWSFFRSGGVRGETFSPRVPSAAREISARLDVCVLGKLSPSPEMSWVVLYVILFAPAIMARREDSWSAAAYLNSANLNRLALSSRDRNTCCKEQESRGGGHPWLR